jgi:hypothetical protein
MRVIWASAGRPHPPGCCEYVYFNDGLSRSCLVQSADGTRQAIGEHMPQQQLEEIQQMLFLYGLLPGSTDLSLSLEPFYAKQAAQYLPWTREAMRGAMQMEEEPPLSGWSRCRDLIYKNCEFLL